MKELLRYTGSTPIPNAVYRVPIVGMAGALPSLFGICGADGGAPEAEIVELDPKTADELATKSAEMAASLLSEELTATKAALAEIKAMLTTPVRTEIPEDLDAKGAAIKPGSEPVFYGGYDKYAGIGDTDAERATNLFLAQKMLRHRELDLSPRGREVMVKAAQKAVEKQAREPVAVKFDRAVHPTVKGFIGQHSGEYIADAYKAMTSTGADAGDEWVPTFASSELWRDIHLATVVAASFPRVSMPTNPYTLPTLDDDVTFRGKPTENVAVTASDLNTGQATLTAKTIQAEVNFSDELDEDSIIPVVPAIRANLVRRGAQTIDDLLVHGDTETAGTGNVNSDDTAPASNSFYLQLDGLRKFCLVTNTGQVSDLSGAVTAANFTVLQGLLQRYGARSSELRVITETATWLSMRTISEVLTMEKYGPNATIVQGELARIFNIPILPSESIPLGITGKVAADGKYTTTSPTSANDKGWMVVVHPQGWRIGFRRELRLETFKDIQKGMNIIVASFRQAQIPSGITTIHTAVGRNITV